jgi:hypothetical protein
MDMRAVKRALAAAIVWLLPSAASAQSKSAIPTLGVPGMVILGVVLGVAGAVMQRRRH